MKLFLFLFLSLLAFSCNQVGLGAITAAKNAVILPFKSVSNIISNHRYLSLKEKTNEKEDGSCLDENITPIQVSQGVTEVINATRDTVCKCKAWGDCSKTSCPCSSLCPNDLSIFKRTSSLSELSKKENSLSFNNARSMAVSDFKGTAGYCWGHASLTSQFNRLAFFNEADTNMKEKLDYPAGSSERQEALTYYKRAINSIGANQVAHFPGFANLHELSSHPDLQSYLANKVAKAWANRAMSFQGMTTALAARPMSSEKSVALLKTIVEKVDDHQQPQVIFTAKGKVGKTHALLVSHYKKTKDGLVICLRDNNYSPSMNGDCKNRMTMNKLGGLVYNDPSNEWGELGGVRLAHNDNADALKQFHSLKKECRRQKECLEDE